jgi:hypothetical protein
MYQKEIVYDRETRDYAMYLDGELVGFARTYHEAEVTLDQLVFELISGEHFREQHARPAEPAPEATYVPAVQSISRTLHPDLNVFTEPGGLFDVHNPELEVNIGRQVRFTTPDCPYREGLFQIIGIQRIYTGALAYRVQRIDEQDLAGCPALPDAITFVAEPGPRCLDCGCRHICAPDGTIRCVACASKNIEYVDDTEPAFVGLPAAPSQPLDIAPAAPASPSPRDGSRQAPDTHRGLYRKYHVERLSDPNGKHADCSFFVLDLRHDDYARQALGAYIDACQFEYPQLADDLAALLAANDSPSPDHVVTPLHDGAALTAAPEHLYRRIDALLSDWKDSGAHLSCDAELAALAQARELEQPSSDRLDFGRRIWEAYTGDGRGSLLAILRDADEARRRVMAEALDAYLVATLGASGGVELILRDWASLLERTA